MVGRQFAHYVVLGQAGAGAMGVVYRARDESLQRDVALKLPARGRRADGRTARQMAGGSAGGVGAESSEHLHDL